jgi:hypothetical protein
MLQTLRTKLVECEHPVGIKKTSNWKLPPEDFSYGKVVVPDKEGVSISKIFIFIKKSNSKSYKKLESS